MNTILSLQTGLNADLNYYKTSEHSIINDAILSPENSVNFSYEGRVLLAIVTLGVIYVVIKLLEDYRQNKVRTDVLSITTTLLNSIERLDESAYEEKKIRISLSNGNEIVFTERCNSSGYCTVIEEKKPRALHVGKYNEKKAYIYKSFKEIKETLVQDIISHKDHYSYKEDALIDVATYLKQKSENAMKDKELGSHIIQANKITHPVIFNKKNIGVKLREEHVPGYTTFTFLSKKNMFSSREHIVLGVATSCGREFVLSASSGDDRNIYSDKNVKYIKLGLTGGDKIEDVFENLVSELKKTDSSKRDFVEILRCLYPKISIPLLSSVA
ncbi:hypothetical protein [Symbiopectobacterium sp.]|uniref:hypothetical protein n=1 Tax=Symbiopectobacterium sp. TaxID=2952789 RepID=UPI003F38C8C5